MIIAHAVQRANEYLLHSIMIKLQYKWRKNEIKDSHCGVAFPKCIRI